MKDDTFLRSTRNPWTAMSRTRTTNLRIYSSARYDRDNPTAPLPTLLIVYGPLYDKCRKPPVLTPTTSCLLEQGWSSLQQRVGCWSKDSSRPNNQWAAGARTDFKITLPFVIVVSSFLCCFRCFDLAFISRGDHFKRFHWYTRFKVFHNAHLKV